MISYENKEIEIKKIYVNSKEQFEKLYEYER